MVDKRYDKGDINRKGDFLRDATEGSKAKAAYSSQADRLLEDFKSVYGNRNPISRVYKEAATIVRDFRKEHKGVFKSLEKDLINYAKVFERNVTKPQRDVWAQSSKTSSKYWKDQSKNAQKYYNNKEFV